MDPKRIFDLLLSPGALLLLIPLFIFISVWVKLDSKGPVLSSSSSERWVLVPTGRVCSLLATTTAALPGPDTGSGSTRSMRLFSYFKDLEDGERRAQKEKILIYGSDATAILLKQALEALQENCCQVMGFIDDDSDKVNKYIEQTKVYHSTAIETLARKHGIQKLVVSSELLSQESKKRTIEKFVELGIKVLTVPPSSQWLYGKLQFSQLKDLRIEALLQREPILLQRQNIFREVLGKRILVTGAAGSIGSEIVRQLLNYQPEYVVLCDQAETPLHELQLEVEDLALSHKVKIYMASIQNPEEAILTNVAGTKNLADISISFGVEKFVMISTDKTVKPTNIMGASKRLADIYIQSLNEKQVSPRFITTRFIYFILFEIKNKFSYLSYD